MQEEKTLTNPISQEAEPQPFPSCSLNRCLQLYWVKGITDADYFMHRGRGKPSKCFNSCSLYEGKHELKHFCWTQLRVLSKGRERCPRPVQSHQGLGVLLLSGHKKHSEEHHGQPSNTGLYRHSTCSARVNLGLLSQASITKGSCTSSS